MRSSTPMGVGCSTLTPARDNGYANDINDAGQITGRMLDANGTRMPYVATPIAPIAVH